MLWKRASSSIEGKISWFFSSCGGKFRVPLELRWGPRGPQGPDCVAAEKSGLFLRCEGHFEFPLDSLLVKRAVSRVQLGDSVFLSSSDRDLGYPVKVQLGSQASSGVEKSNSAFLFTVKLPVEFRQEFGLFQEDQQWSQASHHVVRGHSVFHWSRSREIGISLEMRGNSVSFYLAAGSGGFNTRFNR